MAITLPDLYPHQEQMRDEIRKALRDHRRAILQAPPGTGKTRIAKWVLASFSNRPQFDGESGKALFSVHRRGLVDNAAHSFDQSPRLPNGVIMSGRKQNLTESVQVASIDTLVAWHCKGKEFTGDTFDLIGFDECHSHLSKLRTFLALHDAKREAHGMKPAFVLGLSATPQHKELHEVFNKIVNGPEPSWLIDNGFLKPFRYFRATSGKAGLLVKSGDDYTEDSIAAAMEGLCGDMVRDWLKFARGRATVGFFPRRTHAAEAVDMFRAAGVNAMYLDGDTSDEERLQMFADLNEGRIDYIANVGVIERGTDIPRIGCVQMCVFVGSIVRWLQMIGRGSRIHPDVPDCLVLDHGDGVKKGWFFEDTVHWSLEWGQRPAKTHESPPTIQCPKCGLSYRGGKCKCGYEPVKKELKAQGLEWVGGELQEVQRKNKKEPKKKTCEELMISALFSAANTGRSFSAAYMMAKRAAEKQGMKMRVPAVVEIGGVRYRTIPYGNPDSKRSVRDTYGGLVGDVSRDANPYRE
jgi:DNA repair protein RadD